MKRAISAARLLLTLHCEQSTHIVSESLDRDLSAVEKWAVRLHSISCWSCRRFGKQMRQLRAAVREHHAKTSQPELSPDAMQRIRDAIDRAG